MKQTVRKIRFLSALVALIVVFSTAFSVFALPDTRTDPEKEPKPPVMVAENSGYNEQTEQYDLYLTLTETAGSEVQAVISDQITEMIAEYPGYTMPGGSYPVHVVIRNESGHTYAYQPGSFVLETADPVETTPDVPLTSFVGFDGKQIPLTYIGAIPVADKSIYSGLYGKSGSAQVSLDMLFAIYDVLEEKGYTGENALSSYMLSYYNNLYQTAFLSWEEMQKDSATWNKFINATANWGRNSQYETTAEELDSLIAQYPEWDDYIYVTDQKNGKLEVQLKFPEQEMAALSYNVFYQELFAVAFGDECTQMNPNRNTVFTRSRGVGDYMSDKTLQSQADTYFAGLENADCMETGSTVSFDTVLTLDGPGMGNAYQYYEFSYWNALSFEQLDTSYQIVHQYYTSTDGGEYTLDGTVEETPVSGLVGDVVSLSELKQQPVYQEKNYEYRGEPREVTLVLNPDENRIVLNYYRDVLTPSVPENPEDLTPEPPLPDIPQEQPPQTGDTGNLEFWAALFTLASCGLVTTVFYRRKRTIK